MTELDTTIIESNANEMVADATNAKPPADEALVGLDVEENADPNLIDLNQFLCEFGEGLMDSVSKLNPPVYDGLDNPG